MKELTKELIQDLIIDIVDLANLINLVDLLLQVEMLQNQEVRLEVLQEVQKKVLHLVKKWVH